MCRNMHISTTKSSPSPRTPPNMMVGKIVLSTPNSRTGFATPLPSRGLHPHSSAGVLRRLRRCPRPKQNTRHIRACSYIYTTKVQDGTLPRCTDPLMQSDNVTDHCQHMAFLVFIFVSTFLRSVLFMFFLASSYKRRRQETRTLERTIQVQVQVQVQKAASTSIRTVPPTSPLPVVPVHCGPPVCASRYSGRLATLQEDGTRAGSARESEEVKVVRGRSEEEVER